MNISRLGGRLISPRDIDIYFYIRDYEDLFRYPKLLQSTCDFLIEPSLTLETKNGIAFARIRERDIEYEVAKMLNRLGLIEVNWGETESYSSKGTGSYKYRFIYYSFKLKKAEKFRARALGETAIVRVRVLKELADKISRSIDIQKIESILTEKGVPEDLIISSDSRQEIDFRISKKDQIEKDQTEEDPAEKSCLFNVFLYYTSSPRKRDNHKFFEILWSFCLPDVHFGKVDLARKMLSEINIVLNPDRYVIVVGSGGGFRVKRLKAQKDYMSFEEKWHSYEDDILNLIRFDGTKISLPFRKRDGKKAGQNYLLEAGYRLWKKFGNKSMSESEIMEEVRLIMRKDKREYDLHSRWFSFARSNLKKTVESSELKGLVIPFEPIKPYKKPRLYRFEIIKPD